MTLAPTTTPCAARTPQPALRTGVIRATALCPGSTAGVRDEVLRDGEKKLWRKALQQIRRILADGRAYRWQAHSSRATGCCSVTLRLDILVVLADADEARLGEFVAHEAITAAVSPALIFRAYDDRAHKYTLHTAEWSGPHRLCWRRDE